MPIISSGAQRDHHYSVIKYRYMANLVDALTIPTPYPTKIVFTPPFSYQNELLNKDLFFTASGGQNQVGGSGTASLNCYSTRANLLEDNLKKLLPVQNSAQTR